MTNTLRYSLIIALCFVAGRSMAQEREPVADSGFNYAKYRGVRKYFEGVKYLMEPRLSGEMKNLHDIDQAAHAAFKKLSNRAAFKAQALPAWKPIGGHQGPPTGALNSGRTRDMAFGPGNLVYLATAGGGLWKTQDITGGGTNQPIWVPLTDRLPTLSLGSVAVDPTNPDIVYLGTGEKSPDGYDPSTILGLSGMGDGLYKSNDGGLNWTRICDVGLTGDRISEVLVDPKNPQTIYVACNQMRSSTGADTSGGVLKSTDGGATWRASNLKGFGVLYMVMDTSDTQRLYVSGGGGSVYRTTNGGDTWTKSSTGITGSMDRTAIAISPSSPNVLYASVGKPGSGTNGLYVTDDYCATWKKLIANPNDPNLNYLYIQPWFANAVAVHPTIPKLAIAGGLNVIKTQDSGKTITVIGEAGRNIHADIHNILYNTPTNLFVCNDGGLSYSKNNGNAWVSTVNNGLATLEFVGVDADKDFTFVLGGTQDNGTNRAYVNDVSFIESNGGDGGRTWISPLDSNICYTTQYETSFFRSLQAGRTPQSWERITVSSTCPFYPRYDADESGEVIALGASSKIVVSVNGGIDAFAQKSTQTITSARAVRVFPSDANYMWAGSGSGLWRSTDMGQTFTRTTISNASSITDIDVDPADPQKLWICSQGYGSNNPNVFKSTDGGATVTPLPNFPPLLGCNAIARQHSTGRIFVGTDQGVVYTENEGQSWFALSEGMPNVPVNSMKIKGKDNDKLLAGTYGRGMFWLDLAALGTIGVDDRPAVSSDVIRFVSTYPNPVVGSKATIAFSMKEAGLLTSTLLDVMGREVKLLEKATYPAGTSQFDLSTEGLASGTYIVLLTTNGVTVSERLVVN